MPSSISTMTQSGGAPRSRRVEKNDANASCQSSILGPLRMTFGAVSYVQAVLSVPKSPATLSPAGRPRRFGASVAAAAAADAELGSKVEWQTSTARAESRGENE